MSQTTRRFFLGSLSSALVIAGIARGDAAWQFRVANIGSPPATAVPVLTPTFFTARSTSDHNTLTQVPTEPTAFFGSGFKGRPTLRPDIANRERIPANSTVRITFESRNLDPAKGGIANVTLYAVGELDAAGNALSGVVSAQSTIQTKAARVADTGTFFTCGYGFDVVNPSYPADRYVCLVPIVTPVNGRARRGDAIFLLLEGTARGDTTTKAVYVDPVGGLNSNAGTAASPFKDVCYGVLKCPAAGNVFVDCSAGPASLDYSFAYAKTNDIDHVHIKPWPGRSARLSLMKRSGTPMDICTGTLPYSIPDTRYSVHFPKNRVVMFDVDVDLTNIRHFTGTVAGSPPYTEPVSIGFNNPRFFFSSFTPGQPLWRVTSIDSLVYPTQNYRGFMRNAAGRVAMSAGMTGVFGAHLETSWDHTYVNQLQDFFSYFDYDVSQKTWMYDSPVGAPLAVDSVDVDPTGQRVRVRFRKPVETVLVSVAVASNVATISCFEVDGVTKRAFGLASGQIIDFASESGNPLSGLSATVIGYPGGTGASADASVFTATVSGVADTATTAAAYHFSTRTAQNAVIGPSSGNASGEGKVVSIMSGLAKSVATAAGSVLAPGRPAYSTPDYASVDNFTPDNMTLVSFSNGINGTSTAAAAPNSLVKPGATVSGNVATFRGIDQSFAATLLTQALGQGRVGVLSAGLPVGFPNMAIVNSANTTTGAKVGDTFAVRVGVLATGGGYATGAVTQVDSGATGGPGKVSGIRLTNPGQYTGTAPNPTWAVTWDARSDGTSPNGVLKVSCSYTDPISGLSVSNTFQSPIQWGNTVRLGSRVLGRVAQVINNTASPVTDNNGVTLPPFSFAIEAWDGGADLPAGTSGWSISYDLHGLSLGNMLMPGNGDTNKYRIEAINGPVVTLSGSPSVSSFVGTDYSEFLSDYLQTVFIDRCWDAYGVAKARQSNGLAAGDLINVGNKVSHVDRFQIEEQWSPAKYLDNCTMQCVRMNGIALQYWQMGSSYANFSLQTGLIRLYAAGETLPSGSVSDGLDVGFSMPTLPVTSVPSTTATKYMIDGKVYWGYTFSSNLSARAATTLPVMGFSWLNPNRVIRIGGFSKYPNASFRLYKQTWDGSSFSNGSTSTITIIDDQNVINAAGASTGAAINLVAGDTYQQPVPLDLDSVIVLGSISAAATAAQGRVYTPSLVDPAMGRIDRPFWGPFAAPFQGQNGTINALSNWRVNYRVNMIATASTYGYGVKGQFQSEVIPAGGPADNNSLIDYGGVQCTDNVSEVGTNVQPSKGATLNRFGFIDSLHSGFGFAGYTSNWTFGPDGPDAIFVNSLFKNAMNGANTPSYPAGATPVNYDAMTDPSISVDAGNFAPLVPISKKIAKGTLLFPWDCYGNPVADDGTAVIGARQAA